MLLKELSPYSSPLTEQQISKLQQAVAELSPIQLAWVSGYLAGLGQQDSSQPLAPPQAAGKLTILYGSQTGNAKGVAEQLYADAQQQDIAVQLVSMADYKPKDLKNETHLLIVVSTNGEGEPPDDAMELHEFLASKKAPKLEPLNYGVLALGDSSYEFFCQAGKDFDERLKALGATPLLERVDCDVDYEDDVNQWAKQSLELAVKGLESISGPSHVVNLPVHHAPSQYSKQNPFAAELLTCQKITGRGSHKDIRHIELSLDGSGLHYQPGDALGIWFENDPKLVARLLARLGLEGGQSVQVDGESMSLQQALCSKYELTQSYPGFVEKVAEWSGSEKLQALAEDKAALREYAASHQIIDVLSEAEAKVTAEQLLGALRKLTPRLYSIASSQAEVDDEVHLTVGVVSYDKDGEERLGGASGYLAKRLEEGAHARIFIEHNDNFRLPEGNTPVVMVGPGTGIAPFRAFMQQRDADGAKGKNWLFFGNPHFTEDFLYQVEWQQYVKSGLLSKIDLAFSRDQEHKIYVQDKLRHRGAELWQWLQEGAHFYVCGDANKMAKDVHLALVDVVAEHGAMSREQAEEYVTELRRAKRYQRDVY